MTMIDVVTPLRTTAVKKILSFFGTGWSYYSYVVQNLSYTNVSIIQRFIMYRVKFEPNMLLLSLYSMMLCSQSARENSQYNCKYLQFRVRT